jgi:hypothetical protein
MNLGVTDSSGLKFYYATEAPVHNAGILYFGHAVTPAMLIPPGNRNHTIAGICSAECTNAVSQLTALS